uniref:Astacin domain-containing protein n=1 Tax=Strongyloides venezuelensis TaxID=75913 RepID=A0A0K0G5E1_STRVS
MFLCILLCLLKFSVIAQSKDDDFSKRDKRSIEVKHNVKFSSPSIYKETTSDGINFLLKDELAVLNDKYKKKLLIVHLTKQFSEQLECIKHIIGRAFGLQLETSRYDRDKYVTIN